jgi:hypothetical protein
MNEVEVINCVSAWLVETGYTINQQHVGHEPGIDIEADRAGNHRVVEAKGDGNAQNQNAQRLVNFHTGLGQLLKSMNDAQSQYSIALPDSPPWRELWSSVPRIVRRMLNLSALFAGEDGHVDEVWLA